MPKRSNKNSGSKPRNSQIIKDPVSGRFVAGCSKLPTVAKGSTKNCIRSSSVPIPPRENKPKK